MASREEFLDLMSGKEGKDEKDTKEEIEKIFKLFDIENKGLPDAPHASAVHCAACHVKSEAIGFLPTQRRGSCARGAQEGFAMVS